jgi:hypothetical protein
MLSQADVEAAAGEKFSPGMEQTVADKHVCLYLSTSHPGSNATFGWVEGGRATFDAEKRTQTLAFKATPYAGVGDEAFSWTSLGSTTIVTIKGDTVLWVAASSDLTNGGEPTAEALTQKLLATL